MSYITVEVEIDHGRILPRGTEKLPEKASGLLTILPPMDRDAGERRSNGERVKLPLIQGDGKRIVNPTSGELDASLWGD